MADRAPRGIHLRGEEAADKPEGVYSIYARCSNCEWTGVVDVPKGTPVPAGSCLDNLARCEECGCHTLVRIAKPDLVKRPATGEPLAGEPLSDAMRRLVEEAMEREHLRERISQPPVVRPTPAPPAPWVPPRPQPAAWPSPNYWSPPNPDHYHAQMSAAGRELGGRHDEVRRIVTGTPAIQPNITQLGKLSDGTPIMRVEP